jgi:hypothetical protein
MRVSRCLVGVASSKQATTTQEPKQQTRKQKIAEESWKKAGNNKSPVPFSPHHSFGRGCREKGPELGFQWLCSLTVNVYE